MNRLSLQRFGRTAIGVTLLAALAITATPATAADHRDGSTANGVKGDSAADINDVYAFMDGTNDIVLGMTVEPFATNTTAFSDAVQYVFHVNKHPSFGGTVAGSTNVICEFDATQNISCWIGTADYVSGDASATTGLVSDSGDVTVFAGRRADPFYFYLSGFNSARAAVIAAVPTLTLNPNACPILNAATGDALRTALTTPPNDFATANVLAIVLKIDKSLLTDGTNEIFSVYASTHTKP